MRTREISSAGSSEECFRVNRVYYGDCANPSAFTDGQPYTSGFGVANEYTKVMHDEVTPNFFTRIKKGEIINNPFDSSETTLSDVPCVYEVGRIYPYDTYCGPTPTALWRGTVTTGTIATSLFLGSPPSSQYLLPKPDVNIASLIDLAVTQAWARCDLSEVDTLLMISESRETILSLVSIFKKVLWLNQTLRLKNLSALARFRSLIKTQHGVSVQKVLAQNYMEARYAMRPLFYDVVGCLNAYHNRVKTGDRLTFRGYATDSDKDNDDLLYEDANRKLFLRATAERTVTVRSGVLTQVRNLSKLNVWGFDKIAEGIWDRIPYSFVIDWFINVGQTIASLTPEAGLSTLASWYVVNDTTYRHTAVVGSEPKMCQAQDIYCVGDISGGSISALEIEKCRVPSPTRSWYPTFKLKLDGAKLLDLVIILKQLFTRKGLRI